MTHQLILILDFGGQYTQLIARRVRELNVFCEIVPYNYSIEKIKSKTPKGIILSGSPQSVTQADAMQCDENLFQLGIPVLGICYGGQLISKAFGGIVSKAKVGEYGRKELTIDNNGDLFKNITKPSIQCWMSHFDHIEAAPKGFEVIARTESCPVAAMKNEAKKIYAIQFHPEVEHTEMGKQMLENFVIDICNLTPDWTMGNYVNQSLAKLKKQIGDRKAICGLSGGVDSSVAAVLLHKAIGKNLICVFVDHGLLRKNEGDEVEQIFRNQFDMNLIRVNAKERFLMKLVGVTDPEKKRKIIGEEFIRVFEDEKKKLGKIDFLVQGTIYPDVIESGTDKAAVIKSHHNVGGLPKDVDFELVEPLNLLFKDEVRRLGKELQIPEHIVMRQPFPGPGLAIRILGEITEDKIKLVQDADWVFRDEIAKQGLQGEIWQYFAMLPNIRTVGVMGDERTYTHTIALRAVTSVDGMTADWARIPHEVLATISNRIVNEVRGVNRVVYDITSKPPSTIEYE